jgi:hypothetical protein
MVVRIIRYFCRQGQIRIKGSATGLMGGDEKDGYYCTICGGIPPDQIKIKKIPIDGKDTGIDRLDWILRDVAGLGLTGDEAITDALILRVQQFNYIPTKKMQEYRTALLREYRMLERGGGGQDKQ